MHLFVENLISTWRWRGCIAVVALTPWVTVLGYETVGHRHNEQVLAALEEER